MLLKYEIILSTSQVTFSLNPPRLSPLWLVWSSHCHMLVQKNSTILNFIFRWVYLENIAAVTEKILSYLYCYCCNLLCGNFAPESRLRIYSTAFILWHFWVFLLREGTCTTPISSHVKLPLSPLLYYFLCSSGIPPSTPLFLYYCWVHWNYSSGKLG